MEIIRKGRRGRTYRAVFILPQDTIIAEKFVERNVRVDERREVTVSEVSDRRLSVELKHLVRVVLKTVYNHIQSHHMVEILCFYLLQHRDETQLLLLNLLLVFVLVGGVLLLLGNCSMGRELDSLGVHPRRDTFRETASSTSTTEV